VLTASGEQSWEENANPSLGEKEYDFVVGEEQVSETLERCVKSMKKGEVADYAVFNKHKLDEHSSAGGVLHYRIALVDMDKPPQSWELKSAEEKFDAAATRKGKGNDTFKGGKYKRALKKYEKAAAYLTEYSFTNDDKEKEKSDKAKAATQRRLLLGNEAACYVQMGEWVKVRDKCKDILKDEPRNFKALLRRGRALLEMDLWEDSKKDLNLALEVTPGDREVVRLLANLEWKEKKARQKEAKLFGGMFGKLDLGYPDKGKETIKKEAQGTDEPTSMRKKPAEEKADKMDVDEPPALEKTATDEPPALEKAN